jgi:hypothetical protein
MKSLLPVALIAIAAVALSGCVHTRPSVTHAHLGHCLTHWHDTPENQGLIIVAERELNTASQEVDAALAAGLSATDKLRHIRGAAHALAPDIEPDGPGLDYGAVRALESAVEHLEYAATSDDASQNIVSSVATLAELGFSILERLRTVANQAASVNERDVMALDHAALELRAHLRTLSLGSDIDADGRVDADADEAGMLQLRTELNAMLARESNPSYEPLPRKYVLGLVKLPTGKWGFSFARNRPTYGY